MTTRNKFHMFNRFNSYTKTLHVVVNNFSIIEDYHLREDRCDNINCMHSVNDAFHKNKKTKLKIVTHQKQIVHFLNMMSDVTLSISDHCILLR